ncbi:MAG TPA: Lrp/AsnC family transcriptional regulator [Dongiaceae bacterium]|nr:Lrp/AsnC family transcriptional regulator [Dongiaceae bacterium]
MSAYDLLCDNVMPLAECDRRLVELTQAGLPLVAQPYHELARKMGISADEVMLRLQRMQEKGVIRRIAALPNLYKLGYRASGMTVWNVPDEKVSKLGEQIGGLDFVSHCYHRPRHLPLWPYNLFAMVHGASHDEVDEHIAAIDHLLGEDNLGSDVLYSTRILKKTGLRNRARE